MCVCVCVCVCLGWLSLCWGLFRVNPSQGQPCANPTNRLHSLLLCKYSYDTGVWVTPVAVSACARIASVEPRIYPSGSGIYMYMHICVCVGGLVRVCGCGCVRACACIASV